MHIYWGYIYPPHSNWQYIYGIPLHQISVTYYRMHIHWGYIYPHHSNWTYIYGIALHQITFTYSIMHIYWGYVYPLKLQLTTQLWNNVTPNTLHTSQNAHILRIHIPPNPIDNRSMEYHYTTQVSHIAECTNTEDTSIPPNSDWQHTYGIMWHQINYTYHRMHI